MCQQDFDFGLVRTVGKMERRRETCNAPRKSHASSNSSRHDYNDDAATHPSSQSHSYSRKRNASNNNMISPSLTENSLEDGSQGSEISGLDHQLPSMEKRERNGCIGGRCNSLKKDRNVATITSATCTASSHSASVAGCTSCSRERRDDYCGNDFGECHQHQLYQKEQHQKEKICRRQVVVEDRAFSSELHNSSTYNGSINSTQEIDTVANAASEAPSDSLYYHRNHHDRQHHHQNTSSSACPSSASMSKVGMEWSSNTLTNDEGKQCRQQEQRFLSGLSRAIWIQLGMLILLSLNLQGVTAVRINNLSVPHIVRNGTNESVILDCDYSIEDHEKKGLVVKWYFTNKQTPVYQWIPNSKPSILGILKGKLNLDYVADRDEYKMKRALQIIQPTTELSGNWICHVSTFEGDALEAGRMIVFAPEKEMEMKVLENRRANYVNVSCWANRVFPKPKMTFYSGEQEVPDVTVWYDEYDGAYDVRAYKIFEETTLSSMIGSVFDCELAIPSTNYINRRTTVFEPGSLELKDAMRMSDGHSRVSWNTKQFFIPLTLIITIGLAML